MDLIHRHIAILFVLIITGCASLDNDETGNGAEGILVPENFEFAHATVNEEYVCSPQTWSSACFFRDSWFLTKLAQQK